MNPQSNLTWAKRASGHVSWLPLQFIKISAHRAWTLIHVAHFSKEDAVEIYADTHAASATAKTAATVVAATISESRGALAKMPLCCI